MTDLALGSVREELPAWPGGPLVEQLLYSGESRDAAWRLVEMGSSAGRPWRARVTWGYGGGTPPSALLDVATAQRATFYGRVIQVYGANLSPWANPVRIFATDVPGPLPSAPTYTHVLVSPANVAVDMPPFARRVRCDTGVPGSPVTLTLEDPMGMTVLEITGDNISPIELGITSRLRVSCAVRMRVLFELSW